VLGSAAALAVFDALAACGPTAMPPDPAKIEPCRGVERTAPREALDRHEQTPPLLSATVKPRAAPPITDPCFGELDVENDAYAESERGADWGDRVRRSLLSRENAESVAGPLAWRAVEALMARRFDQLSTLIGPDGLCLRAAKGASCVKLDARAVARCSSSPEKHDFPVDSGDDNPPPRTCAQAMTHVFLRRDFRHPTSIHVNCFPEPGRGNNAHTVVQRPAALFVNFHAEQSPWQSLWLIFDGGGERAPDFCARSAACDNDGRRLYLVEIMAEYWGI
jgi:hypothetical protein